jgi:hypothetical protein
MEMFWYIVAVVVGGVLLATGLIMTWYWLVGIGLVVLPLAAVWGMVSSGPGSRHNPYHH